MLENMPYLTVYNYRMCTFTTKTAVLNPWIMNPKNPDLDLT